MCRTPINATCVALLCVIVLADNMMLLAANAITFDNEGIPVSLSGDEFIVVRDTALSDPRVKELIDGRNYRITDCCGFYKDPTSSWQPVINIEVAGKLQIGVTVDLEAREVTAVESMPVVQHQVPRSDTTAAEELVKQTSNENMTSIPMFATNSASVTPIIVVFGVVLGGAAAGILFFARKGKNSVVDQENNQ